MKQIRKINNLAITIIMVVILLVALSTATFAWFSASNIVNLSRMDFTIGMNEGIGDLMISWGRYDDFRTVYHEDLTFDLQNVTTVCGTMGKGSQPSMPKVAPYKGMTIDEFEENLYTSQVILVEGEGDPYYSFRANGIRIDPCYVLKSDEMNYSGDFYIYNKNPEFDLAVSIDMKTSGLGADALRMAVFVDDALVGIVGKTNKISYGEIVRGAKIDEINFVDQGLTLNSANGATEFDLPQNYYDEEKKIISSTFTFTLSDIRKVRLMAYFDGGVTSDSDEGGTTSIDMFRFMGEYIEKE